MGRSVEAGELEDPWLEPPEDAYLWTKSAADTPDESAYIEIGFERGVPISVDGESMGGVALISHLNTVGGEHGVGRIDHVENRLVGIKSREIYECPAAVILHAAHKALETMTLSKEQARTKARIAQEYSDVIYNGLWYTAHRADLDAYVQSTQRHVTGEVRLRLHKGAAQSWVGRRRAHSTTTALPPTTGRTSLTTRRRPGSSAYTASPCAPRTRRSRTRRLCGTQG